MLKGALLLAIACCVAPLEATAILSTDLHLGAPARVASPRDSSARKLLEHAGGVEYWQPQSSGASGEPQLQDDANPKQRVVVAGVLGAASPSSSIPTALPARQPGKPIQRELLRTALAARTVDNKIMLMVGNAAAVLAYLPTVLTSMQLADESDMSQHLVVVTPNEAGYLMCSRLHRRCVLDDWATSRSGAGVASDDDEQGRQRFQSAAYMSMMWRKPEIVRDLLHAGIGVVCMDMDIVVFRNILRDGVLDYASNADMLNLNEHKFRNDVNAGFYYARPSPATQAFVERWTKQDTGGDKDDQEALNFLLLEKSKEYGLVSKLIPRTTAFILCNMYDMRNTTFAHFQERFRARINDPNYQDLAVVHCACWNGRHEYARETAMAFMVYEYHMTKL